MSNSLPKATPPSPNAAALGKYGDIPVTYSTGIPSISIPLIDLKGKSLSLPIGLSYHASGVKVDEVASNVGLGWALNAGGVITRTVMGLPDEQSWGTIFDVSNFTNLSEAAKGQKDVQSDMFFFNVSGYSGKFFIDPNKNVRLITHQDVKISFNTTLTEFTITTPDGTLFKFGGGSLEAFIERTESLTPCAGGRNGDINDAISTWHLREIEHITGDKIQFTYESQTLSYTQSISEKNIPQFDYSLAGIYCTTPNLGFGITRCSSVVRIYTKRVTKISTLFYNVTFAYNHTRLDLASSQALTDVCLKNSSDVAIKKMKLAYDYFSSPENTGTTLTKRLKLLSVTETSGDDLISLPPHEFSYLDESVSETYRIPSRLSTKQDHWGFVNNNTTGNLTPTIIGYTTYDGATDRETDAERTKAGIIDKIKYPTGGYTKFEFEANKAGSLSTEGSILKQKQTTPSSIYSQTTGTITSSTGTNTQQFTISANQTVTKITWNCTSNPQDLNNFPLYRIKKLSNNTQIDLQLFRATGAQQTFAPRNYPGSKFMILDAGVYELYTQTTAAGETVDCTINWATTIEINQPANIGGVRIKSMTNYTINDPQPIIKTFEYLKDDAWSSGILISKPFYQYKQYDVKPPTGNDVCGKICSFIAFSSSSKIPLGSAQGSHVFYKNVTVNENGGKRKLTFSFVPDVNDYAEPFGPNTSMDWARGQLENEKLIDANANTIQETTNTYENKELYKTSAYVVFTPNTACIPLQISSFQVRTYEISTNWTRLKSSKVVLNQVETNTEYAYDDVTKISTNPIQTITKNSNNQEQKVTSAYTWLDRNVLALTDVRVYNNNKTIGGIKNEYKNFTFGATILPLQWRWSNILKDSSVSIKGIVPDDGYNVDGALLKIRQTGFNVDQIYSWTNGLLTQKTFGTLNWYYDYYDAATIYSRQVKVITDENGLRTKFSYDPFLRLVKTENRFSGTDVNNPQDVQATTNYDYHYKNSPTDNNYVGTSSTFKGVTTSLSTKQYLDGLGRPI
jgi:hypothetical protein